MVEKPKRKSEPNPLTWTRLLQRISSCTIELMNLCAGVIYQLYTFAFYRIHVKRLVDLQIHGWLIFFLAQESAIGPSPKEIGHSTSKGIGPLEPYRASDFSWINYKTPKCRKGFPNYARNQQLDPPKKRALTLYSRILGSPNHQF